MLELKVYNSAGVFDELEAEWNRLLAESENNRIFLTWEWQSTWWDVYQPGQLVVITVRSPEGVLIGIAPWFIDSQGTVKIIGCEDVTDYLDLIAHRDCSPYVYEAIATYLKDHRRELNLCNIPGSSPTLEYFPEYLNYQGFDVEVEQQEVCPVIDLPDSFEEYLASLDKKQRHEVRRKIRRAGDAEWYIVGPEHDLDRETEIFLQLMRSAAREKAEFLEDEQNLRFFRRIIPVFKERGWLQLSILSISDAPAAAYLNFDYHNEILVYNSGLDLEAARGLSPGIVLLARLIEDAIKRGRERFDLLRGNEEYKYRMGGKDTEIFKLRAY